MQSEPFAPEVHPFKERNENDEKLGKSFLKDVSRSRLCCFDGFFRCG